MIKELPADMVRAMRQLSKEIREAAKKLVWVFADLGGLCAYSAYELTRRLRALGYKARFVEGEHKYRGFDWGDSHCWTEWEGYVLDLTAKQFGKHYPYIYVAKCSKKFDAHHRGNAASREVSEHWYPNSDSWKHAFRGGKCRLK